MTDPQHPAAVAATLVAWHTMVASGDLSGLPSLVHPDATFRSPMAFKPYPGAKAVTLILTTVISVFEDFIYHRSLATGDGFSAVLEFSATVAGRQLKGIDLIRFDAAGLITDFEVMVRPLNGLQALGEEMGRRLGPLLAAIKTGV